MDIDITKLSPEISQANLQMQIGFALMDNAKEMMEVEGDVVNDLISSIPTPGVGENIDISL